MSQWEGWWNISSNQDSLHVYQWFFSRDKMNSVKIKEHWRTYWKTPWPAGLSCVFFSVPFCTIPFTLSNPTYVCSMRSNESYNYTAYSIPLPDTCS